MTNLGFELLPEQNIKFGSLMNRLYASEGVYDQLQSLAFGLGKISCAGNLATFNGMLPNNPREAVTLSAKENGGLTVARDITTAIGDPILRRYCLLIPSNNMREAGRLIVSNDLLLVAANLMSFLINPTLHQQIDNFTHGLDKAIEDVNSITGLKSDSRQFA